MSAKSLKRILVANRGEIAVRIMKSCHELGIETVAVFSDPDRDALHVHTADYAIHVGPAEAAKSYLNIDRILQACKESGADAVHPGYGFLSENGQFAEACAKVGITFIGPSAASMRMMGDKPTARKTVTDAGVPVVPGNNGPSGRGFPDSDSALVAAKEIGFPIMLKAAAGGGGKGMRLVHKTEEFVSSYQGAQREAKAAFGDDVVYLEKAIVQPRHVEVQVFADGHGNVVHLGERDCSIQRRHQKVVEESPSPAVTDELRHQMGDIAVKAARSCDYLGAGTIEFLLDSSGSFYFLEMNTRLQVEHPVTEILFGVDLVAWQIAVAEGKKLPLTQDELNARRSGASIECRIYAEDPIAFLPAPGSIETLRVPEGPYVRNDLGVEAGSEVSVHYDPMLAKLIVWAADRPAAIARMRRALSEYQVTGSLQTNLAFHRRLFEHGEFCEGTYDTGYIGRHKESLCASTEPGDALALEKAIISAVVHAAQSEGAPNAREGHGISATNSPSTSSPSAWRLGLSK